MMVFCVRVLKMRRVKKYFFFELPNQLFPFLFFLFSFLHLFFFLLLFFFFSLHCSHDGGDGGDDDDDGNLDFYKNKKIIIKEKEKNLSLLSLELLLLLCSLLSLFSLFSLRSFLLEDDSSFSLCSLFSCSLLPSSVLAAASSACYSRHKR